MGEMKSVAAYLDLAPAISATRSRPEQIEFSNNILHHPEQWAQVPLRQRRRLALDAACDCSPPSSIAGTSAGFSYGGSGVVRILLAAFANKSRICLTFCTPSTVATAGHLAAQRSAVPVAVGQVVSCANRPTTSVGQLMKR
jgi:hypothetical protein